MRSPTDPRAFPSDGVRDSRTLPRTSPAPKLTSFLCSLRLSVHSYVIIRSWATSPSGNELRRPIAVAMLIGVVFIAIRYELDCRAWRRLIDVGLGRRGRAVSSGREGEGTAARFCGRCCGTPERATPASEFLPETRQRHQPAAAAAGNV
jgi:hypothetical protein